MNVSSFETESVYMAQMLLVTFQAPGEDVDRIMQVVIGIDPLVTGSYDSNAFQSSAGTERYRPREGAAAGVETELRKRPGTVEVSFEISPDEDLAMRIVEAIFRTHSYQEPVIRIQPILASRSKGLDDSANPNRWWNTTGDWKSKPSDAGIIAP